MPVSIVDAQAPAPPALCTDIKVVLPDYTDLTTQEYISTIQGLEEMLVTSLKGPRGLSLRVTLSGANGVCLATSASGREGRKRHVVFDHLWSTLLKLAPRWAELHLSMDADLCQWAFNSIWPQGKGSGPNLAVPITLNLTSLKIGQHGQPGTSSTSSPFALMHKQLWTTVQDLELYESHTQNLDDVLDLLAAFPNIVTLVLERSMKFWGPYEGRKRVVLSHLEAITFKGSPPVPGFHSALIVTSESLRSFTFCDMIEECLKELNPNRRVRFLSEHNKELMAWMKDIGKGLTELTLSNNHIYPTADWMVRCLKENLLPNLTDLTLLGRCDTDFLLDGLAAGVCARLERFVCVPDKYEDALMTQMTVLNFLRVRLGDLGRNLGMTMPRYVHIGIRAERKELDLKQALDITGKADFQGAIIKLSYIPPRAVTLTLDSNKKLHKDYS